MSEVEEMKLEIKVVINKEKTRVLFAEAGSDFTDVLLSFLLLPLGTIVNILEKHYGDEAPVIGSLNTLYNGVANLGSIHFLSEAAKQEFLLPASCYENESLKLRLNVNSVQPRSSDTRKSYDGVYTEGTASFIISNDLRVMPNMEDSFIKTLSDLSIAETDLDGAETRDVAFGLNEIVALLRGSMVFSNPLTAVICGSQTGLSSSSFLSRIFVQWRWKALLNQIGEKAASINTKKMILKVVIQKSTNKLLFAQADYDFINFLFGVLTIPVGKVEWYLGSKTGLTNMDNLHRGIAEDNNDNMHLKSEETKGLLMKSTLPTNCYSTCNDFSELNFDPSVKQHRVKGTRMYMVSDDLTVAPSSLTSCLSVLDRLKICLSDVEELELEVGFEEGLSILKASLTSTTALTDGIKPLLRNNHIKKWTNRIRLNYGQKRNENGKPKSDQIEMKWGLHLVPMQIFVETLTGEMITLKVHMSFDTLDYVTEQMKDIMCTSNLRLFFGGRMLRGGGMLADYNIPEKSTLYALLQLRGGGG